MSKKDRYVAFDAANYEFETFETFEQALRWLDECNEEGISEECANGMNFIAQITHRSHYDITDKKEDYHEHTNSCPENCDEEEWPHDSEFDYVGQVSYVPIKEPHDD